MLYNSVVNHSNALVPDVGSDMFPSLFFVYILTFQTNKILKVHLLPALPQPKSQPCLSEAFVLLRREWNLIKSGH